MVARLVESNTDFTPPVREPWMDKAACRNKDYRQWFPETKQEIADAKEFCTKHCDVRLKCLAFAMLKERPKKKDQKTYRDGVFGGLTGKERETLQKTIDKAKEGKDNG